MSSIAQRELDAIAKDLALIHGRYYGRGPSKVLVECSENFIVAIFEETFTPAEKLMIADGGQDAEQVQRTRHRFQQKVAEEFKRVVEHATGREVRSFVSDTDLEEKLAIETFILTGAEADMSQFEREMVDSEDGG